jgi:3-methylcrotonyl-CoA carboxylase alpha subunit
VDDTTLALAALGVLRARARPDAASPWTRLEGWQLNGSAHDTLVFADGDRQITLVAHFAAGGYRLMLPGGPVDASATLGPDGALAATVDGHRRHAEIVRHGAELTVFQGAVARTLVVVDRLAAADRAGEGLGRLIAPMPGRIVAVHVAAGQSVRRGQKLVVLEAMKMEHTILAPADGVVSRVRFAAGDQAAEGDELVAFDEPPEAKP